MEVWILMSFNKKYLIINSEYISNLDFSQINETSAETVRKNLAGNLCIIEWDIQDPDFLSNIGEKQGPYSIDQILQIVSSDSWVDKRELHPIDKV
jgi:hypothetical protein